MKRLLLFFVGMILINSSYSNERQQLDTIYANSITNVALFFPTNIRQGIVGSENFVFTYNREKGQSLGLLKATKGNHSNLLVITTDGKVYSYIIQYADYIKDLNRFVKASESIGNEKGGIKKEKGTLNWAPSLFETKNQKKPDTIRKISDNYAAEFLEKSCTTLLNLPERTNKVKRKNGLSLGIKNLIYYKDLVFMQFEIKNKSGIDFDIDTLEVFKVNGNNKRKASYQELPLKPFHVYGMPESVKNGVTTRFIYVLNKFTLGDSERIRLLLTESHGSRNLAFRSSIK